MLLLLPSSSRDRILLSTLLTLFLIVGDPEMDLLMWCFKSSK